MKRRSIDFSDRHPRFHVRFRGFDRTEVVAALAKLASENEEARREIERVGAEMERLEASVDDQRGSGRHVERALIAASKAADELRDQAEEEARRIVRAAEEQGHEIVQRLRDEARGIEDQIEFLQARRREVEASLESFLKLISKELEQVRQHQTDEPTVTPFAKIG